MIDVRKINDIRSLGRSGESVAGISRRTGVSEPTVRKYLREEDFSPKPPDPPRASSPAMEPYAGVVDGWLEEDRRCWRKQRHTAKRVYDRLVEELGFTGSYSTVRRYVKARRDEMASEAASRESLGYLLLEWLPGEAQVDFGQADIRHRGVVRRAHSLTMCFPHSNVGLTQSFWGETAECVCQGLMDVFLFVGGVPGRIVFDNATEIGRRVGDAVRTSELFALFAAHFGFDYSFTNPYSGNEKGCVENKVGATRRSLFVPVPSVSDIEAFNARLLERCLAMSEGKPHWRKGADESALFADDLAALSPLPDAPFSCVRWVERKADKQGTVTVGGPHRYSAGPALAGRMLPVALRAFRVDIVDPSTGEVAASYEREWGDEPTDSADPALQLRLLCQRPGGWRDSRVRAALPGELAAFLDSEPRASLAADLRALRDACAEVGWDAAVEGMRRALASTGSVDAASVALASAVAASGDARTEYADEVDLAGYDLAFRMLEGGGHDAA